MLRVECEYNSLQNVELNAPFQTRTLSQFWMVSSQLHSETFANSGGHLRNLMQSFIESSRLSIVKKEAIPKMNSRTIIQNTNSFHQYKHNAWSSLFNYFLTQIHFPNYIRTIKPIDKYLAPYIMSIIMCLDFKFRKIFTGCSFYSKST